MFTIFAGMTIVTTSDYGHACKDGKPKYPRNSSLRWTAPHDA